MRGYYNLLGGLHQEAEVDEGQVVTGVEAMPEGREKEGHVTSLPSHPLIAHSECVCVCVCVCVCMCVCGVCVCVRQTCGATEWW